MVPLSNLDEPKIKESFKPRTDWKAKFKNLSKQHEVVNTKCRELEGIIDILSNPDLKETQPLAYKTFLNAWVHKVKPNTPSMNTYLICLRVYTSLTGNDFIIEHLNGSEGVKKCKKGMDKCYWKRVEELK